MSKGTLFIVTGPSGAGKGTVLGNLLPTMENIHYSISATTRPAREGEREGVNYYFLSRQQFDAMVEGEEFLEHAEYVGNCYGTPAGPVDESLERGQDVILEIEVQGALIVKEKRPEAKLIFIIPPHFSDLEGRLRGRGSESDELIAKRLQKAQEEYKMADRYDFIVLNDEIHKATEELRAIITAHRCAAARRINLLR